MFDGHTICPCGVSKEKWYKLNDTAGYSLATRVFLNCRKCPFCAMRGRMYWGKIRDDDISRRGYRPRRLTVAGRLCWAVFAAFRVFFAVIKWGDNPSAYGGCGSLDG